MGLALLVVLVVLAGLTLWRAQRHEAAAAREYPPSGDFLEVDGKRVHFKIQGSGPDLVLIHGSSGNLRDMTFGLMDRLAQDYRVIAFDRPGLGYTDRLNGLGATIDQQAALLARAARQLGAKRPIVMGQSYGGAVALAWGVNHPDQTAALVLVSSPAYPWDTPLSTYYQLLSHPWLGPLVIPLLTAWVPESVVQRNVEEVFLPQSEPAGYAEHFGVALTLRRASLRANALQRAGLLAEMTALSQRYDALSMPIELVHGDADTTVGAHIHAVPMSQRLPNAHLTLLEGVGHMPHHNRPGAVIEAIHRAAIRAQLR
ncbi:alpha/beta hydrolase [Tropicibacter oceani]|uniref:Alpha/beta hydrolase n=1 Tax=Tropicibacter oceani TaxID=3058420 RepID=A0ABY8QMH7_9RHOB|nr:alpha/beta hydrolase [Tropicibacter oceani]